MSIQQEIIKTALLGTDKYQFKPVDALEEISVKVLARKADKEDAFLKNAAVAFLYEECGQVPVELGVSIEACPDEERTVISPDLNYQLQSALQIKDDVWFDYLMNQISAYNKVVSSELVPRLLNKALEQKRKAADLLKICGETGRWLCGLNKNWTPLLSSNLQDQDWETGSVEGRKEYFKTLRESNPSEALAKLESTFDQESAAIRADFLAYLRINLSATDEPFLQKALKDKSKTVKDLALDLLRILQGSSINLLFIEHLAKVISVTEERVMLISRKKVLHIDNTITPLEEVFKSGIEKLSSQKGVDDHIFWFAQMLAYVDSAVLAKRLDQEEDEWLKLLLEHKHSDNFVPFLTAAAINFIHSVLAEKLLERDNMNATELLHLIQPANRVKYLEKLINDNISIGIHWLLDDSYTPLPKSLAEKIIKKLSTDPYQITQPVYQRLALQMPADVIKLLNGYAKDDSEEYQRKYFRNQAANMLRYIELRDASHF
jgi:predicted nucleic acid-binding protein